MTLRYIFSKYYGKYKTYLNYVQIRKVGNGRYTHFASSANAQMPAARGAEADVPV